MGCTWQASSTYLKSMTAATRVLGHGPRVLAAVGPTTLEMMAAPHAQGWWPGEVLIELVTALGTEAAKEVSVRASRDGMGPLVRPLAGVVLALAKSPVEAMLTRLNTFVSAGVKGVTATFVPNGTNDGGTVAFTFPEPVPPVLASVWFGMFDVGFSLARGGRLVSERIEPAVHHYTVAW